jgi:hypothetical protein
MMKKAETGAYASLREWCADFSLIVSNCRAYNPPGSQHAAAAGNLEAFLDTLRAGECWKAAETAEA